MKICKPLYVKNFLENVAMIKFAPKSTIMSNNVRFFKTIYIYFLRIKNFSYFPKNLVEYKKKNNQIEIPMYIVIWTNNKKIKCKE